jgi:hypothetical protein
MPDLRYGFYLERMNRELQESSATADKIRVRTDASVAVMQERTCRFDTKRDKHLRLERHLRRNVFVHRRSWI